MTLEEHIRSEFEKYSFHAPEEDEVTFLDFRAGYMALLNSLEHCSKIKEPYTMSQLYRLPEGVEK